MENFKLQRHANRRVGRTKRQAVSVSQADLVRAGPLRADNLLPLVIRPALEGVDLADWASNNLQFIEAQLAKHGALLFRNFNLRVVADFERLIKAISPDLLNYQERSSPRSQVSGNIYTSTDYPADQSIFFHNENSYQHVWPRKLFFFCLTAAEQGGQTPIADVRRVFTAIDPEIRESFARRKWMLVRNFDGQLGLTWQTVFQTTQKSVVEEYCRLAGIEVEWRTGDRLRTRVVRPALATHPGTKEPLWFNHLAFFHVSTLEPAVRAAVIGQLAEDELPSNTFYGDGAPIEPEILEHVRAAYRQQAVLFEWEQGDVLLLDNMLTAHARTPFVGERRIVVGMAEPFTRRDASSGWMETE